MSSTATSLDSLAADAVDFIIALLLPLILPKLGNPDAARALALRLLASHNPTNERDLQLTAEAIGFSIRTMVALGEAADPEAAPDRQDAALRRASSLSRSGLQVHRCLIAQRREQDSARKPAAPHFQYPFPIAPLREAPSEPLLAEPPPAETATPPAADPPPPAPEAAAQAEPAPPELLSVRHAEAKLRSAQKLLELMKAHHKGAPPPHTRAAQDIQAQQRAVDAARMALAQARIREAHAA
ncbi:MAG: hypothetical protein ACJ8AW_44680 [Rhodopila sp.]